MSAARILWRSMALRGTLASVPRRSSIDVYRYLDYRTLLRDFYADRKKSSSGFSYRAFSRRAGLGAPNHLKRVIDGDRNITPEMARRFADACGFIGKEAQYFCTLVELTQARTTAERQAHYEALLSYRGYQRAQKIDTAKAAYHAQWYVPAVRELAASAGFREDPTWIASRLLPAISPQEAEHALAILIELGLLVRDRRKRLVQAESVVSTGAETSGLHIVNYHRTMMQRAIAAIDLVPRTDRDISALTMCVSREGLARLKQRVQDFRRELVGLEGADGRGEIVVQINFQLYPLTQLVEENDGAVK
jgi:uncharacterized protein (TIGR02147 family)